MEPYFFIGTVHPERAGLRLGNSLAVKHLTTGRDATATVSVLLNQVGVWVESEDEWDIYDLRNLVKSIVQTHLSVVGFLTGCAYELEITRVVNRARGVDYVFGIDIPCLSERAKGINVQEQVQAILAKMDGANGMYLDRCFNDLVLAMKHADDTGFYCYRAIESLRHHCASVFGLTGEGKSTQWQKFRLVAGCDESAIREIQTAAKPTRHGDVAAMTSDARKALFNATWDVVHGYLNNA